METIYSKIKMPEPYQIIAQNAVNFFHKIVQSKKPAQVYEELEFPARNLRDNAPRLWVIATSKRFERTLLFESCWIYANLHSNVRDLPMKLFEIHIKKWYINTDPNPQ